MKAAICVEIQNENGAIIRIYYCAIIDLCQTLSLPRLPLASMLVATHLREIKVSVKFAGHDQSAMAKLHRTIHINR